MAFRDLFSGGVISSTGMAAERLRMEVIANNLANAHSTKSANGGAFRRQDVVFAAVLNDQIKAKGELKSGLGGVQPQAIVEDQSEMPRVHLPGHPDADAEGYVTFPNVNIAIEMVNLMTATRAYEANLKAAQAFRQISEQALSILRS
jgi:flagellar basal-body rod protein FlgC